jgi:peptide/nickel transport system substrate-binding protein
MKKVGSVAAGVCVAALLLAACSSSSSSSGSSGAASSGTPKYGGTLNLVGQGDVDNMDPAVGYTDYDWTVFRAFTRQLYNYAGTPGALTQVNLQPDVATALPTISNSGKTYTITIRQGVMWNTNPPRQVTAEDFIYGLKRLCNPANPSPAPQYYTSTIVGFADYCTKFGTVGTDLTSINNFMTQNNISGLSAPSSSTLVINLTQPASDFTNILAEQFASAAPQEYSAYVPGSNALWQHMISDGPYAITAYNPTVSITFAKNAAWKQSSDPLRHQYVSGIQVTEGVATPQAALSQIQAGTQDMFWDQYVTPANLAPMVANHDPNLFIGPDVGYGTENPTLSINLISPNNGGALGKLQVREALEYAMNKTAASQVYGGAIVSQPLNQLIPPGQFGNVSGYNPYPTPGNNGDPAKSKQLLAAAGYQPNQITLNLIYRTNGVHPQLATTDQAALQAAGFKVNLVTVPTTGQFYSKYLQNATATKAGQWDIAESGWVPDWFGNNGRANIQPLYDGRTYAAGNSTDYGDYNSPVTNGYIDAALAASSVSAANHNWSLAAQQIMKDAAVVPMGAQKIAMYHSTRTKNTIFWNQSQNFDVTQLWLNG